MTNRLVGKVALIPIAAPLPPHITNGMGRRGPLACGKVRFYGDPVAIVIADDRYTARDACDVIEVDYELLPVVVDPEQAMQPDAPLLYEEFGTNIALSMRPPSQEIDRVFEQTIADGGIVVKQRLVNQRLAPAAMETRGVVAEFRTADNTLTVWIPHRFPTCCGTTSPSRWGFPSTRCVSSSPKLAEPLDRKPISTPRRPWSPLQP
jgi:aerobic carbon-monoxide dehydrogenase large subunit